MPEANDEIITYIPKDDINLMNLLPEYFQRILNFQEIMSTEEIELKRFYSELQQVWKNLFIQTADESTLEYHENLLSLTPDPDDTLEVRRWRIINRYRRRPPFTLPALLQQLNEILGIGNYNLVVDYPGKSLRLELINADEQAIHEAKVVMITLPPAHLDQGYYQTTIPDSTATIHFGMKILQNWVQTLPKGDLT